MILIQISNNFVEGLKRNDIQGRIGQTVGKKVS